MYELVQVNERTYYINCPAKIGVYLDGDADVYLIDSGNDKEAGRKVRQLLEKNGWHLQGILNTHSNADHIGGNQYLQAHTGCRIFAGGIEAAFTAQPILEPSFLYGGYPFKDLRHKFLLAKTSEVTPFTAPEFPAEVQLVPLPGHFFDMVGFRTPDDTVFLADCLSSRETLDKYAVSFIYDVAAYLQTLKKVEKMQARVFVPSHAEAGPDMGELTRYNRAKVLEVADCILNCCREPATSEQILQRLFAVYNLTMNMEQYVLVGSTVRSYLAWLRDEGRAEPEFQDNLLFWRAI